jgi:hypothetical protein
MECPNCKAVIPKKDLKCKECGTYLPWIDPETGEKRYVPNYLAPSILVTIFCCFLTGIICLIYATQVNGRLIAGEYEKAVQASMNARLWCWISVGAAVAYLFVLVMMYGAFILAIFAGGVLSQ